MKDYHEKTKEINPNFISNVIFVFYWRQGKYREALEIIEKVGDFPTRQWVIGMTYTYSGEKEKAEEILRELIDQKKEEYVSSVLIAKIYVAMGDNDNAFKWYERAYDEHDAYQPFIKTMNEGYYIRSDPRHKIISDPRYKAFLRKMGLPED